jgi:hypothetical protein
MRVAEASSISPVLAPGQKASRPRIEPLIFDRLSINWDEIVIPWKLTPPPRALKRGPLSTFAAPGRKGDRDVGGIVASEEGLTFPDWGQWRIRSTFGVAKLLLLDPAMTDADKVLSLLGFVATNCWHSANDCYLTYDRSRPSRFRSAELFDKFFHSDQPLGLHCGHIAKFFCLLLASQGFESRLAKFKGPKRSGHIVTEARLPQSDRWLFADADFGLAIEHQGRLIDAETLYRVMQSGRADELVVIDVADKMSTGATRYEMGFAGQVTWTPETMGEMSRANKFREGFMRATHSSLIFQSIVYE